MKEIQIQSSRYLTALGSLVFKAWLVIVLACSWVASSAVATTLQVVPVFQPLSFIGTDSDARPEGFDAAVQGRVMSRPMVVQGALPEALVQAIAEPHRIPVLPQAAPYDRKEANLVRLCRIGLDARYRSRVLVVTLDLKEFRVDPELALRDEQVLRLTIEAVEKTLGFYGASLMEKSEVEILIHGTRPNQANLGRFEKKFFIGG